MSELSEKQRRKQRVQDEAGRREQARLSLSPLNRLQLLECYEFVGRNIVLLGHDSSFRYTRQWLDEHSLAPQACLSFFSGQGISDDWSLLIKGDPYKLFGASEQRLAFMPIELKQLQQLIDWQECELAENPCEHDTRLTEQWLAKQGLDVAATLAALLAQGGGCDCEIAFNVDPADIYP